MYSDRNIINRGNVREDHHTAYQPDRDFLIFEVTARVVAAAFEVLGMGNKTEQAKNLPIPAEVATWDNLKKLVVDKEMMDETITSTISAQERQEMVNEMELNPDGHFPCRFPGCSKSFNYNGKSRKRHELSHDPPVDDSDNCGSTPTPACFTL